MDAVAPDGPECARKGLRSPADMQSLFRAATEADTGATRPLPASLAVAQRGEKGGQHWAAWRKCGETDRTARLAIHDLSVLSNKRQGYRGLPFWGWELVVTRLIPSLPRYQALLC